MEIPPHLHERYGVRKKRIPAGVLAIVLITLSVLIYPALIQDQVSIRLISWTASETEVTLNWRYEGAIQSPIWCLFEAQDEDRFDIGFAYIQLDESSSNKTFQHTLTTTEKAFAVLTPVCEQDIDLLPGSYFKPGVLPSAQLPPLYAPWQLP